MTENNILLTIHYQIWQVISQNIIKKNFLINSFKHKYHVLLNKLSFYTLKRIRKKVKNKKYL